MASASENSNRDNSRSAAGFWKGVVVGIAALLVVLVLIVGGSLLMMGRCPMCGRMMGDDMMGDDMMGGQMMNGPDEQQAE